MKTLVVVMVVVVGVLGGFYGGYKVGQNNVTASASTSNARGSGNSVAQGRGGFGAACPSPGAATPAAGSQALARGTVTNLTATSMTISNGTCVVKVTFTTTTAVNKQVAGSTSDLTDNLTVTVNGVRQADGSVLAQSIQIGNAGGPNRPGTSSTPSPGG